MGVGARALWVMEAVVVVTICACRIREGKAKKNNFADNESESWADEGRRQSTLQPGKGDDLLLLYPEESGVVVQSRKDDVGGKLVPSCIAALLHIRTRAVLLGPISASRSSQA
jgi:hypothetical protein